MTLSNRFNLQDHYGDTLPIAVIAASCRMPRANDIFDYWRLLADGEELIERFDAERLASVGVDPALLQRPDYVAAAAVVEDADRFDWSFFGYSKQEAQLIDPQQRLFLMCAWEALEMAGYPPAVLEQLSAPLKVGVIGSCKLSTYSAAHFDKVQDIASPLTFTRLVGNDKDYLATRVSYKLGLTGSSFTVQTACSSSLVGIHLACEQLASGESDMVLAGGAGIGFAQESGYFHREGMIFSADGHCRPFDAQAGGTAIGNGVGVVLLKRLDQALADGDSVLAIVRGSAVNNDGSGKAGYTAPSPEGQARVIAEALSLAEVDPASIHLVEAHGTATALGDPIEVQALTRAWRRHTHANQYCALGSVKSNLGHLDTAAGVASFLKTALALHHGQIPPSLHYTQPNPAIDFDSSPFYVPQMLLPWPDVSGPRRAAVSAFAIGGTNCHAVLEQAPETEAQADGDEPCLLVLSARSESALRELARRHAWCLGESQQSLGDYCATSVHHRSLYPHRLIWVGNQRGELMGLLHGFAEGQDQGFTPQSAETVHLWASLDAEQPLQLLASTVQPDWHAHPLGRREPQRRVLLPTCPFEGERCWYEPPQRTPLPTTQDSPWQAMTAAAADTAARLSVRLDLSALPREAQGVDALHATYVGNAFDALGLFRDEQDWLDVDACLQRANAPRALRGLFARLLRDLVSSGVLSVRGQRYGNLQRQAFADPAPWLVTMRDMGYGQLADLVERAGPRLGDMLCGRADPVSVVFPGAATDDVEHMYQDQPYSVYLNQVAAAAVAGLARQRQPLRILEVGGGTGGTTRDVLAQLPPQACARYTFTDIGPLFLKRAKAKFSAYPFMEYRPLDMNAPVADQDLEAAGYDLIIAANVLHNAPDLAQVLGNLATLLAPGGVLLMREITEPKKLFDFVFGPMVPPLLDSDGRNGELFANLGVWQAAARAAGFVRCEGFPGAQLPTYALGEQIILAQRPEVAVAASVNNLIEQLFNAIGNGRDTLTLHRNPQGLHIEHAEPLAQDTGLYQWRWKPLAASTRAANLRRVVWISDGQADDLHALSDGFDRHDIRCVFRSIEELSAGPEAFQAWLAQRGNVDAVCLQLTATADVPVPALLNLLQAVVGTATAPRLTVLTAQGFNVSGNEATPHWQAPGIAALLGVARQEYPALSLLLLDRGDVSPQHLTERLLQLWSGEQDGLRVCAVRANGLFEQTLVPTAIPAAKPLPTGRHVLIGGLCDLGLNVARWLVQQGARDLVLLTRRPASQAEAQILDALRAQGVNISVDADADAADPAAFDAALERLAAGPALGVVMHLAGVVDDAPLVRYSAISWTRTLATKLTPALALQRFENRLSPAMTVYFSSAASLFAPAGQGAHAFANGQLEGLAQHRSQQGHKTVALAWGFWGQIDRERRQGLKAQLAQRGMLGLGTEQGLALLGATLGGNGAMYMPCQVDWTRVVPSGTGRFAACLPADYQPPAAVSVEAAPPLALNVREQIAQVLGCALTHIQGDTRLVHLGLDSLLMLDLVERLNKTFAVNLSAQDLFQADTADALCAAVQAQLGTPTTPPALEVTAALLAASANQARPLAQAYLRSRLVTLLHCDDASLDDAANLVHLGLDSLLLLDLCETLKQELQVQLSAQAAFEMDTFGRFVDTLVQTLHPAEQPAVKSSWSGLRDALNELQQRDGQWLAANGDALPRSGETQVSGLRARRRRLAVNDLGHQLYVEYDKPAGFDVAAFEHAWNLLIARHPMARASLDEHAGLQLLAQGTRTHIPVYDWRNQPISTRDAALAKLRERLSYPTQPAALPFEWHASRLDEHTLRLHLRLDTTLIDIESVRIVLREINLWMSDPQRRFTTLQFSAQDYYTVESAIADTQAQAAQYQAYTAASAQWPTALALPVKADTAPARYRVWREALPRAQWLALKEHGLGAGLSATAVLAAVYAVALMPCTEREAFSLRLDYPERKPLHAQVMNVVLDASDTALLPFQRHSASFMALARDAAAALARRLEAELLDGASLLSAHGYDDLPRIAMTSLLGVRTTYAIPETSDPLLGMPSYELASQPSTDLHLQVLEEESALLYNLDLRVDRLEEAQGLQVIRRFQRLLERLAASPQAWDLALAELLQGDTHHV